MKKYKILLISLIICFICTLAIGLTACTGATGETGAQGEQGIQGEKGDKGDTGGDGDDGLSAYELYIKNNPDYTGTETEWLALLYGDDGLSAYELYLQNNPDYTGTEAQWLDDLVNGKLATVTYTVTFNSEGGSEVESQTVSRGGKITEPTAPTLAGHTFLGWYVGEEKWSFLGYSVTENVTLTAKWSVTNTDITYTLNNETETYEVTAYSGTDEVIDILPAVDNIAVTAIAANAFKGNTSITTVIIPETVTSIGISAFNGCTNLTTVTLPASLKTLGSTVFGNTNIETVYYNGGLSDWLGITFGSGSSNPMFYGAALYFTDTESNYVLVESVTITGVTAINSCAFYGCTSLTSVTIGADVTSIGDYAFKECTNLTTVDTQGASTLATIGTETFYGCTSLTTITVPVSVTSFGTDAFSNDATNTSSSLTGVYYNGIADQWASITFGNGRANPLYKTNLYLANANGGYDLAEKITLTVATINSYAFYYCNSIVSVTLGEGVTTFGTQPFVACFHITEVINNSSLTISAGSASCGYVAYYAYYIYTSSSTDSGEFIIQDDYTFYAHTDGSSINYYLVKYNGTETDLELPDLKIDGTSTTYAIGKYTFSRNTKITSVIIPDKVDAIDGYAFSNCTSLKSVVVGKGVTSIQSSAFYSCTALTTVYYNGTFDDKANISISSTNNTNLTNATWYYYSETQPTETGNYWHYVSGVPTIWTNEQAGE